MRLVLINNMAASGLRMESFEQDDSGVVCNFKAELDKESQQ